MSRTAPLALAGALVLIACGPRNAPEETTAQHEQGELPIVGRPWGQMSFKERKAFMAQAVVPMMEAEFVRFDGARYASFSCDTCHGPDMAARNFAMPNPSLLALHPTGSPEQQQMVQDHPEMVKFMFNHVLPKVQQMLDHPDFDPATQTGFSCYACHPSADAEVAATGATRQELAP